MPFPRIPVHLWVAVAATLLVGCEALRPANRADNQVYTRREWAARQQAGTTPTTPATPPATRPDSPTTDPSPESRPTPEATGTPDAGRAAKARKVIATAKSYLGVPYVYGGTTRAGLDCSALMQHAYRSVGVELPRTSRAQGTVGKPVARSQILPGDLLLFHASTPGVVGHAGLVVEVKGTEITFLHAAVSGGVRTDLLSNRHWSAHYLYARRLF